MRIHVWLATAVLTAGFVFTLSSAAQSGPKAKGRVLSSSVDVSGLRPATQDIAGPAKITCIVAQSSDPKTEPGPSCFVIAPGFNGPLKKGQSASANAAGLVTLTCNGSGDVKCAIQIQ